MILHRTKYVRHDMKNNKTIFRVILLSMIHSVQLSNTESVRLHGRGRIKCHILYIIVILRYVRHSLHSFPPSRLPLRLKIFFIYKNRLKGFWVKCITIGYHKMSIKEGRRKGGYIHLYVFNVNCLHI